MEKMYPPIVNSPKTELAELITDTQTEITVANASVLLQGEGIAVLGNGDVAETITYTSVEENVLKGCIRGFEGVARAWPVGTRIARNFTAYDHNAFKGNIEELVEEVADAAAVAAAAIPATQKGVASGVATLDKDSKVPAAQLPISTATNNTSSTQVAAASAVKAAYDLANRKLDVNAAFIELRDGATTAGPAYIDFHTGASPVDFDSRIIAEGGNGNTGGGNLSVYANNINLSGGTTINAGLSVSSDAGVLNLIGSTHVYQTFFPKGLAAGRKGYLGFGDANSINIDLANEYPTGDVCVTARGVRFSLTDIRTAVANLFSGNGSPEGAVSAPVGSLYRRLDGYAGETLYIKESGTGNTGWRAVK